MDFKYLKILTIGLVLVFATQGCAVIVRDHDRRHHRRDWHRSSLLQSDQSIAQMTAQNSRESLSINTNE